MTRESDSKAAPGWLLPPPVFPSRIEQRSEAVAMGRDTQTLGTEFPLAPGAPTAADHAAGRVEDDVAVAELVRVVGLLADGLRASGEPALETTPHMTHFEATLRAFCVGYLAGARDGRTL